MAHAALAQQDILKHWGSAREKPILNLEVTNVAANAFVSGRFSREKGSYLFGMNVDNEESHAAIHAKGLV